MAIDLSHVVIHNSPDVRAWRETATITRLEFRPTGVHVEHTKRYGADAWPNFRPPGWDGDLQYTLWIFFQIGGQWHGSGCIQFWQDCDENGGPPDEFAKNWYYAADRWGPMTGHQPAPGDAVGFMVSAGDARNSGVKSLQERSAIVLLPFPRRGDVYTPHDVPQDPQPPPPAPPIPPTPDPTPMAWAEDVLRRLTALELAVDELGDPTTVVHVGAKVEVSGTVRFLGPVKGTGTVTTT